MILIVLSFLKDGKAAIKEETRRKKNRKKAGAGFLDSAPAFSAKKQPLLGAAAVREELPGGVSGIPETRNYR